MSKVIKREYHGQIIQQYDDEYTTLNNYGKRVLDEFIQINYVPYMTKSINKHRTSYGIKHDIERCLKFETEKYKDTYPEMYICYVSNLDVKEAFARAGFKSFYKDDREINCNFNVSKKALDYVNSNKDNWKR